MSAFGIAVAAAARSALRRLHVGKHHGEARRRRLRQEAERRRNEAERSRAFGKHPRA
jgi:hypothetical protein